MKTTHVLIILSTLAFSPVSQAEGWFDSLKSMLGMSEQATNMPNVDGMIKSVSEATGISESQAKGGLAAVFNYAKNNVDSEQFKSLSDSLPGVDSVLSALPDISKMASSGGLGDIVDQVANQNESLKALNGLKKQFESLGLSTEMIMQVVAAAKTYLDTDEGQKIKDKFTQALGKISL